MPLSAEILPDETLSSVSGAWAKLRLWIANHPGKAGAIAGWYQQASTGLVALLWVPLAWKSLGTVDAGIWFAFQNLLGMISLTDFGLSFVVSRQVAFALHATDRQTAVGEDFVLTSPGWDGVNQIYWASRVLFRWISLAGLAILVILYHIVLPHGKLLASATSETMLAWYLMGMTAVISMQAKPHIALLDGMAKIYLTRFLIGTIQLFTSLGILIVLYCGGRLKEMAVVGCILGCIQYIMVRSIVRSVGQGRFKPVELGVGFFKRFFKIAAPMGLISTSGFLISTVQVPLLGSLLGPAAVPAFYLAQKIGLTLNQAVSQITGPQMPVFTQEIAAGSRSAARKRFLKLVILVPALALLTNAVFFGASSWVVALWVGPGKYVSLGTLFLMSLDYTLCASAAIWGTFVLASGRNPFALSTISHGVLTFVLTILLCPRLGVVGIPLASLSAALLTNIWYNPYHGIQLLSRLKS